MKFTVSFIFRLFLIDCNLAPFLSGCETWSVALTEEYRLRVLENGTLRKIVFPKREEVIGK